MCGSLVFSLFIERHESMILCVETYCEIIGRDGAKIPTEKVKILNLKEENLFI